LYCTNLTIFNREWKSSTVILLLSTFLISTKSSWIIWNENILSNIKIVTLENDSWYKTYIIYRSYILVKATIKMFVVYLFLVRFFTMIVWLIGAAESRVPLGKVEVITSKILWSPPWLGWPLWNICVTNDHRYVPLVVNTSQSFPHSRLITGFVTRLTRWVPLVEQELLTLPEHLSSPPVFSGVRVSRSLVLCVCFVDHCLSFCPFSFGHCVLCSSSIYGFWLPLWCPQSLIVISFVELT